MKGWGVEGRGGVGERSRKDAGNECRTGEKVDGREAR